MILAPAPRGRSTAAALTGASLVALAVVCGRGIVETQALELGMGPLLLGAVCAVAAVAVMVAGPMPCLAALLGLGMLTFLPSAPLGGGVDVKPTDAFYVGLLAWGVARFVQPDLQSPRADAVRAAPTVLFVGFAGLTILYVVAVDPGAVAGSFLSWIRVVQTISIGFLAALFVRSTRDVELLFRAVAGAVTVAVAIAVIGGVDPQSEGALGTRGGGLNPNTLGLGSGLLLVIACFGSVGRGLLIRIPLAVIGAVGLVQSQSVGSIVGTCVALTLGLVLVRAEHPTVLGFRAAQAVIALALAAGLAYGIAAAVRPENLPTSAGFESSSTWHRAVVGAAGLELAARNPVIGVGWRRSSSPEVLGDPEITGPLRARFAVTKAEFFPDVVPASVHNTYVQVAAELGLIGLGLLVLVVVSLGLDIRRLLRRVPRRTIEWRQLSCLACALLLILVWLNDNPLYGGQPETVALAVIVGSIAGLGSRAVADTTATALPRRLPRQRS